MPSKASGHSRPLLIACCRSGECIMFIPLSPPGHLFQCADCTQISPCPARNTVCLGERGVGGVIYSQEPIQFVTEGLVEDKFSLVRDLSN